MAVWLLNEHVLHEVIQYIMIYVKNQKQVPVQDHLLLISSAATRAESVSAVTRGEDKIQG